MEEVQDKANEFVERILTECRKGKFTIGEVQSVAIAIMRKVEEIKRPKSFEALAKVDKELF